MGVSTATTASNDPYDIDELSRLNINQLLDMTVVTPSRQDQKLIDAGANIQVITKQMIQLRGYKNLVEVLQDLHGFDFATYEDGGGEYPNHAINRGIGGGPGNPKLLIMVDGIVQNHIAFNWSQLFGNEQIFYDLDRIEVIQGPVSALYGANAFSGVIHFITESVQQTDFKQQITLGEDQSWAYNGKFSQQLGQFNLSAALKRYQTDGDMGRNRPDPAGYFRQNNWPDISLFDYDSLGQFQTNSNHPYAGQPLSDGFNTKEETWSLRTKLDYQAPNSLQTGIRKANITIFNWNKRQGLGSYVPGYEYQTTADSYQMHHGANQYHGNIALDISNQLSSDTSIWYRDNRQFPDTGFQYNYRYINLVKSYHSFNKQWGINQQFNWQFDNQTQLQLGLSAIRSDKMNQIVSLGRSQALHNTYTDHSWFLATNGEQPQLGQSEQQLRRKVQQQALYANFSGNLGEQWSYNAGIRYDKHDDYDDAINPRVSLVYNIPQQNFSHWNIKLLYGEAFREPSFFELNDEFRGNAQLEPEQIKTYELISTWGWQNDDTHLIESATLHLALYHSRMDKLIALVAAPNMEGGNIYANSNHSASQGLSLQFDSKLNQHWSLFANYQFTQGKEVDHHQHSHHWQSIDNTAPHKYNIGINWLNQAQTININWRTNVVSKRKVPASNGYFERYAPSYHKTNLTISWLNIQIAGIHLKPQLIVKNLFDQEYVGVGRQSGNSSASEYHPATNPNPSGFIPAYHPQPGRSVWLTLDMQF